MATLSKKQLRRKLAKERDPLETEKLRLRERSKIPSKVARFLPRYTKREIAIMKEHNFADAVERTFKEDVEAAIESGDIERG